VSDASLSRGDGDQTTESHGSPSRQSRLAAAADVWYVWLFAPTAFVVGAYIEGVLSDDLAAYSARVTVPFLELVLMYP